MNRKQILDTLIYYISGISDKEYQNRVWIKGAGPECDDFDETACYILHEGDLVLKNYKAFGLTENQYRLLSEFRREFDAFSNENYWEPAFIDAPAWAKVIDKAKGVITSFGYRRKY